MEARRRKLEYLRNQSWWRKFITLLMKQYKTINPDIYDGWTDIVSPLFKLTPTLISYLSWNSEFDFWHSKFAETCQKLKKLENEQISNN